MSKFNVGDYVWVIDKNSKRFNSIGVPASEMKPLSKEK